MGNSLLMNSFKDYVDDINENCKRDTFPKLVAAISGELNHRLDVILCGQKVSDLFEKEEEPAYLDRGNRVLCTGVKSDSEHQMTKCMYYYNRKEGKSAAKCQECSLGDIPWVNTGSQFSVFDYQIPMPFKHTIKSIGEIDLIIKDMENDKLYAVEVKPEKGNDESLSRMMAEIITYTTILEYAAQKYGEKYQLLKGKRLSPAIAFFEESKQWKMYKYYKKTSNPEFERLLKSISIFIITKKVLEDGRQGFEFCLKTD